MVKQKAAALIVAIMITVVVATISTAMMVSQHLTIYETGLIANMDSMFGASQGVQDMVKQQLLEVALKHKHKIYTYAKTIQPIQLYNVTVSGKVEDAQGRFNVNLLTQTANMPAFAQLIRAVDPRYNKKSAMTIAQQVSAWVRKGGGGFEPGATYQVAHRPMSHISELRLVKGVTAELMQRLLPYVVALPPKAKMNLNAMSVPVMWSLFKVTKNKPVTMQQVKQLIQCRNSTDGIFKNSKAFTKCLTAQNISSQKINNHLFAYDSQYFQLSSRASVEHQSMVMTSLITIANKLPKWQSQGSSVSSKKTRKPSQQQTQQTANQNMQQQASSALDNAKSLSNINKKAPQKPLYAYVLWQSW